MKYIKIIIPLMLFAFTAFSQNTITGFSWSMGFGSGKTADFVSSPSFTGFSAEGHRFMNQNVSIGLSTGWNILNEQNNESITVENTTITGEQGRYINIIPVLFSASYYVRSSKKASFVPFIRANVGTYYIMQRFDIGVYTLNNDHLHFGVAPELGFMFRASDKVNILTNAKYNYAFDAGQRLGGDETNDYAFYSVNLGVMLNY
jgi:hypothetical protein